ncbi:hypothetical protein SteCoe_7279 [Stentor coeruleus]|uniref:Uncharacterized protein n=1 Tax=Stentor coeruleus TaxID=5963 RepID=A0A1R2CMW0_9CILI|nr:hypothetical protein SteCoe_7279 [Stentor coeruleus]
MVQLLTTLFALCLISLSSATTLAFFITSDTSNWLEGPSTPSGAFAIVTATNGAWTSSITGASWIWDIASGAGPSGNGKFYKYFFVAGTAASASLEIAADGVFTTLLNGSSISCDDTTGTTYANKKTCTISTSKFVTGVNLLEVTVVNSGIGDCGLLYKLTMTVTYS